MANDKSFKIKNGLLAGRYLQSNGVETTGSEGYSLASASYDSVSFDVTSQGPDPTTVSFKPDGTKMYYTSNNTNTVYQYSLSTAWDVSTTSYDSKSFSVATQTTSPNGSFFNADGTVMYICEQPAQTIYQYTLSTAWDISTASYASKSLSVGSVVTNPRAIYFISSGTVMIVQSSGDDALYEYGLSTAYDISTATYNSKTFSVTSQATNPWGVEFNSDGTKMFVGDLTTDAVYQYNLSTAYDITTSSYSGSSFYVGGQAALLFGVTFGNNGTKMYIPDATSDRIYQYSTVAYTQTLDLSTGNTFSFTPSGATTVSFTNPPASGTAVGFAVEINGDGSAITWPSSVKWDSGTAPTATASKEVYTFITTDGGTTYYGKKAAGDIA